MEVSRYTFGLSYLQLKSLGHLSNMMIVDDNLQVKPDL